MRISSFRDIVEETKKSARKTVVAVVEAQDGHTLESVVSAAGEGIISPTLIGDRDEIKRMLEKLGAAPSDFEIAQSSGGAEGSMKLAIDLVNTGAANALMKGRIESADFMKAIIVRENGLLTGKKLSLAGLYEAPRYHKIFSVSDMGMNTYPDLETKKAIIENAARMLNALGVETPKVAVLASVEKVNPKMPETIDADELKNMNLRGGIAGCVVEGPISFDLATSAEAAAIKGYESPVAGDADLLIVPDATAGNILVKCLTGMAGSKTAGTVLGAKVPVIFTSRSAEASDKYYSIALAAYLGRGRSS